MTTLSTTTTDAVAHIKEQFDFTVDKFPLHGPDNMPTPHYGLFRSDNFDCVGRACSARYVPHTTDDVVAIAEAASNAFKGDIAATCHFIGGHFVSLRPTDQTRQELFNVTNGDNLFPRFMVRGGFDGRGFKAQIGCYRDMCSNLIMMNTIKAFSRSIRHTSGLRNQMDELIATFSLLQRSWTTLTELIARMDQKTLDMRDFLAEIYGEPDDNATTRAITTHKNRTKLIMDRLWREINSTQRSWAPTRTSAWMAYNAVQGYEQHDAVRRNMDNVESQRFERVLRAANSDHVRAAEKLALAA